MFNFLNFFNKKKITNKKAIQVINYIKKTIKENEKKIGNSKSYEEIVQLTKKCNLLEQKIKDIEKRYENKTN
jgi:hypothetical protein